MASYDVLDREISSLQHLIPQTFYPIPLRLIQIVLTIEVSYYTPTTVVPFFNQRNVSFPFVLLQNHPLCNDFLYTKLQCLRINTDSLDCGMIVQEIVQHGLDIIRAYAFRCECLYLQSVILLGCRINQQTLMTRALDMSRSDFESNNYGMVAATLSYVKDMIRRITVEDGGKNGVFCWRNSRLD